MPYCVTTHGLAGAGDGGAGAVLTGSVGRVVGALDAVVIDVVSVERSSVLAQAANASAQDRASDARANFDNGCLEERFWSGDAILQGRQ